MGTTKQADGAAPQRERERELVSGAVPGSTMALRLGSALLRRVANYGAVQGFSSTSRAFASSSKGNEILEGLEHATGLEKHEKDGAARGIDVFTEGEAWLQAPFGTPEKPVVVTSSFSERIVGVTDPEDDSIVVWDFIRQGEPPKQIIENGEYFVLKKIEDPEDHYKPHTWP